MLYRLARMVYGQCSAVMLPDFRLLTFKCLFIWAGCSFMFYVVVMVCVWLYFNSLPRVPGAWDPGAIRQF